MRYALLIYVEPWDSTPEQDREVMESYNEFGREVAEAGVMRGGEALHASATARCSSPTVPSRRPRRSSAAST